MELNIWTIAHFSALAGVALYGMHRLWFLYCWHRLKNNSMETAAEKKDLPAETANYPFVTIQLPLFNERFVTQRLIDATAKVKWPGDKLQIQVLDDSTDDTRQIVDQNVLYWRELGIDICVIRRENRTGYKAGALRNGMKYARGEFIALFDADFIPTSDFLERTMPHFSGEHIAMVQARWGFLNSEHSRITAIQSLLLGPHFRIEHRVRCGKGLFFNFNGTAGVWRRSAIESSGGWESDTVTEDLDLSYRAQMTGWRFLYLDDLVVPSELPVTLASFRTQQQRWAKGSVQTAIKILPKILCSRLSAAIKIEAVAHLCANLCWLFGLIVILTLYPTILSRIGVGPFQILRIDLPLFIFSSLAIFIYFLIYNQRQKNRVSLVNLFIIPVFTIGLAPGIALSVAEGFFRRGGIFDRTPKFGITGRGRLPRLAFLYRQKSLPYLIINIMLFCYTLMPVFFAIKRGTWLSLPFLFVFPSGLLMVMYMDLKEFIINISRGFSLPRIRHGDSPDERAGEIIPTP